MSEIEAAIKEAGLPVPTRMDSLTIEWPGLVLGFVGYYAVAEPSPSFSIEQSPRPPMVATLRQWTYEFKSPNGLCQYSGPLSYIFAKAKELLNEQ